MSSRLSKQRSYIQHLVGIRGLLAAMFVLTLVLQAGAPSTKPLGPMPLPPTSLPPQITVPVGSAFAEPGSGAAKNFSFFRRPSSATMSVGSSTTAKKAAVIPAKLAAIQPAASAAIPRVTRDMARKLLTVDDVQYPLRTYKPLLMPNDPLANQPWVTNARFSQAWDISVGNRDTLLAVIDTGFGLQHEEFTNRWYINSGESGIASIEQPSALNCADRGLALSASCNLIDDDANGVVDDENGNAAYQNPSRLNCTGQAKPLAKDCNRIDDDGNGFIDDISGWDFANNDNSVQAGELNPSGSGTAHGTETAGTAAATGNNGKGIAGADWHTKILPIQALDDDAYGDTLGVGRAIRYAAAQHANVISISLGSTAADDYVRESIAIATAAGSVVVASSGNSPCNCMLYPANYPEVVSAGALNTSNQPASFTSYGTNLDIMAPGTNITAPTWLAGNPATAYAGNLAGTSFAAPLVSGLLSRLLSNQAYAAATPLQLIAALTENTNRLTLPASTPRTSQLGYGALDASKATARTAAGRTPEFTYGFTPVYKGNYLTPEAPKEVSGNYIVHTCADGQVGSTPLYELNKPNTSFWSISQTEVWQAQNAGYTSRLFSEVCLQQPQDTTGVLRSLNLYKEFRNIYEAL